MTIEDGGVHDKYDDDQALWDAFAKTVVEIQTSAGPIVVQPGVRPGGLPWNGDTFVITAWNPGRLLPQRENDRASVELEACLRETGCAVFPTKGRSADGSWSEDGFAVVAMPEATAVRIGRRFGQLAIFRIGVDGLEVVDCR